MVLSAELQRAAESLGRSLRSSHAVHAYLEAEASLVADAEAGALDREREELYRRLLEQQQAGRRLDPAEVASFYAMQARAQTHPLIAGRDLALNQLKGYLAEVALDLSAHLGLDYTVLAGPAK